MNQGDLDRIDSEIGDAESSLARAHELLAALKRERRDIVKAKQKHDAEIRRAQYVQQARQKYLVGEQRNGYSEGMYVLIEPWIIWEIQRFREVVRHGQHVLSMRSNVSTKTLREIQNGRRERISLDTADRIFQALDKPHLLADVTIVDRVGEVYRA